jgi:hypothetical protein
MGDAMQYLVLSGISPYVLRELEHNRIKTIEIRSPHNFLSALESSVGDLIFLTSISLDDLSPGAKGIIASIREKQISMHRMVQKSNEMYEEAEYQIARLKLEIRGHGRVRRAISCSAGEPAVVDADEVLFFEGW